MCLLLHLIYFFFNDTATTEIYTLSLHDALPISDGDLVAEARKLTAVSGEDGSVLLFNIHLSSTAGPSIELPGNGNKLPDQHAKQLFEASSTLTPFMVARATELGMRSEEHTSEIH